MAGIQQALIPLTDEDIKARAKMLARLIYELKELRDDNVETRKGMKAAEDELERRITRLARAIREGAEDPVDTGEA